MERKIGEIFEFGGEWYQCIGNPYNECTDCDFCFETGRACVRQIVGQCSMSNRSDGLSVVFKKLEKVRESFLHYCPSGRIIYFQKYKLLDKSYSHNTEYIMCDFNQDGFLGIEIKQNQENMKENKLNLKPFDIQKAREGKPVCTRDGHKARIICFDYNGETGDYPIVALVHYNKGNKCYERVLKYTSDGLFNKYGDCQHDNDLMMLPEKHEGWVNVYKGGLLDTKSYPTKKEAFDKACPEGYVDTVKVCWEE